MQLIFHFLCYLKSKTEQNRNDEKYSKTGITVTIHTNNDSVRATAILLRFIAARLSWRSPVIAHRSEASLRYYIGRPSSEQPRACSNTLSDALTGRPRWSQQPSFTMLSFRARAIFMFQWIRLSFIHKTHASSSLFSNCLSKNLRPFMSHNSVGFCWIFYF